VLARLSVSADAPSQEASPWEACVPYGWSSEVVGVKPPGPGVAYSEGYPYAPCVMVDVDDEGVSNVGVGATEDADEHVDDAEESLYG